jgi:homoserine O-acetyltransferase
VTTDEFSSSDASRSAAPLRHARTFRSTAPFELGSGATLPELVICYETWGTLSPARDNAVLICHAVSGDSHAAGHYAEDADDVPGWWEVMVGPGRPIDTDRYFVVCSNVVGGCRGSTGPNFTNPATGKRWGPDFPAVTVEDMVRAQLLLVDHLGIDVLLAVVGGSLGGFQALALAVHHCERVRACIGLATSPRLTSQAIAFDVVGRNAITHDPAFHGGQYYDGPLPAAGLAIARMLAHITYLSSESMAEKFELTRYQPRDVPSAFEKRFSVGSYLAYQGDKFVERFDANSYVTLSMAMDLFDLGDSIAKLREVFRPSSCRFLLVSFTSDWLYPPYQSRQIVDALLAEEKDVSYCNVVSSCGHDAFLLENDLASYGRLVGAFLDGASGGRSAATEPTGHPPTAADAATNIFTGLRLDHQVVLDLVPVGASVLDLGCGNGELLDLLRARGHRRLVGVELDERMVVECVERGHDVVQSDLDRGLSSFDDGQFDVAILSQTLQAIEDTAGMLGELVRVAGRGIVSFPNFAYAPMREMFYREGRIPKSEGLYGYNWWETPNRRFPSILDFEELCGRLGIRLHTRIYLDTRAGRTVAEDPNVNADVAVAVISR